MSGRVPIGPPAGAGSAATDTDAGNRAGDGAGTEEDRMRALVQRVHEATVRVAGADGASEVVGTIGAGLVALVGATHTDEVATARRLADKIWHLRCFDDADGVMNLSAADVAAQVLVVSQFTLYGDTGRGRRPSWVRAAPPELAEPLVEAVVARLGELGAEVATGRFRAHMDVALVNDGPVTLLLEV
jgi:D-aminoacyl-tRNA deacylase